jgi:hypothetical protein
MNNQQARKYALLDLANKIYLKVQDRLHGVFPIASLPVWSDQVTSKTQFTLYCAEASTQYRVEQEIDLNEFRILALKALWQSVRSDTTTTQPSSGCNKQTWSIWFSIECF